MSDHTNVAPSQGGGPVVLSPAWREAIAFGTIWGALEITVGGFLHSIRFPFNGVLLSLGATCLLVAGSEVFPRRGFALRCGVICAGLKVLGPTGILIGPMVGVLAVAVVIEAALLLPAKYLKAVVAGSLACMWPLAQQLISHSIYFGFGVFDIYLSGIEKAMAWFGIGWQATWDIAAAVAVTLMAIGAAAGLYGRSIGIKARKLYWGPDLS